MLRTSPSIITGMSVHNAWFDHSAALYPIKELSADNRMPHDCATSSDKAARKISSTSYHDYIDAGGTRNAKNIQHVSAGTQKAMMAQSSTKAYFASVPMSPYSIRQFCSPVYTKFAFCIIASIEFDIDLHKHNAAPNVPCYYTVHPVRLSRIHFILCFAFNNILYLSFVA